MHSFRKGFLLPFEAVISSKESDHGIIGIGSGGLLSVETYVLMLV